MNNNIIRSISDTRLIDVAFFGKTFYTAHRDVIRKLTINDCLNNGSFKSLPDFHAMDLPLSIATWVGLRAAVLLAKKKIIPCDNPPVTLENFLRSIKKGSKKFRDVIDRSVYQSRSVSEISVANSFARITNTALPSD
jgi:hypothetical protein